MSERVLRVDNLHVEFQNRRGLGSAVDGVSFDVHQGETLGVVGESGSGKSVTALAIMGLLPRPGASTPVGHVWFRDGVDLLAKSDKDMRMYRGKHLSMVLQDPMTALNPVFTIGKQLGEALKLHQGLTGDASDERATELLRLMHIPSPERRLKSYPHQLSGGMRQRVVGAIALAGDPELLIADEPTTALDVTVQAAYLELLKEIQRKTNVGILFITHDFGVVGDICDRVVVMYGGRAAEVATTQRIFAAPRHPYTRALIDSVPDLRQGPTRLKSIEGSPPSIYEPPPGCRFHPRCWLYQAKGEPEECRTQVPTLQVVDDLQSAACHFSDEVDNRPTEAGASTGAAATGVGKGDEGRPEDAT